MPDLEVIYEDSLYLEAMDREDRKFGPDEHEAHTNEDDHYPGCSRKHEPDGDNCQECFTITDENRQEFALRSRA